MEVADLDWLAIGLLAAGSVVGGYVGARVGRRMPPAVFGVVVVFAGVVTTVIMLLCPLIVVCGKVVHESCA